jgi:hypothetical protein
MLRIVLAAPVKNWKQYLEDGYYTSIAGTFPAPGYRYIDSLNIT